MSTKTSGYTIYAFIFAVTALHLLPGHAAASLVILSNDSFVSANASAGVWSDLNWDSGTYLYDTDSDSASQSFTGQTANPGSFGGNISNVWATAVDPNGNASDWRAGANLTVNLTHPAAEQVRLSGSGGADVENASSWGVYDESLGAASATSRLDLTFSIDVPYLLDLSGDLSGPSFPDDRSWLLTNVDTGTVLSGYGSYDTYYAHAVLSPGTYQLISTLAMDIGWFGHNPQYYGYVSGVWTADLYALPTPVPAAAWLFGSGLLGLIGISRRRKPA